MGLNLSIVLTDSADRYANRPALHLGSSTVTYRELNEASNRVANALMEIGVQPRQVIGLLLPNGLDFVASFFGALKVGATIVPLNVMLRERELRHCLEDAGATVLIVGSGQETTAVPVANSIGIAHVYVAGDSAGPNACGTLAGLTRAASMQDVWTETDPSETAVLLYTSGTTGRPKAACLTHSGMLLVASAISNHVLAMTPDDVVLQALPMSHIFGLNTLLIMTLLSGAAIVLEEHFDAESALDLLAARSVTVFAGVPTMSIGLLSAYKVRPIETSLRIALLAGQSVPPEVRQRFASVFGCRTIECYGISEYSSAVTAPGFDAPAKEASVGRPIWGTQVTIQSEAGEKCAPGEIGEVLVRGVGLMSGYHNQPEATTIAVRDGWLHTGDLGRLDDEGDLFIVDRKKDVIIRGGYNVYPREVEDVLYEHPDVVEVAVVGISHETLGEEVAAAVCLREGAVAGSEELRAFARERLAAYKYPRIIAVLDEIPKSSTGKILKRGIDHDELLRLALRQSTPGLP
jgi:long-chain acyl-CoA synthetase